MKILSRAFLPVLVCALAVSLISCETQTETDPPNIIFFIADDMYPDMFNCLPEGEGKNLTPNMDRLAQEGVVMINQYVVSPVCTPSRFNCLSGRYASRATNKEFTNKTAHEEGQTVIQWNSFLTPTDSILPHYLSNAGYATGMVGKNHAIEANGIYSFPDYKADATDPYFDSIVKSNYAISEQAIRDGGFDFAGGIYHNNPNFIGLADLAVQNLDWTTAAGLEFIEKYHEDQPIFLYFATTVPHGPTDAARSWNADPKITANGFLDEAPDVMPARHTIPERLKEAGLDGKKKENLLWLDDALGALISKLDELGELDNTIIFFFNDHGQKAKGTLYQGGVTNPSIIWQSGGFACGPVSDVKVTNVDFLPTILDMAGVEEHPDDLDGISFMEVLEGSSKESRESLYFELGYARAVIKGNYKYYAVRYPEYATSWTEEERKADLERYNAGRRFRNMPVVNEDPSKPFSHLEVVPGGGQAENGSYGFVPGYFDADQLYDLEADPGETKNLANDPENAELLKEMKEELRNYTSQLPGKFDI